MLNLYNIAMNLIFNEISFLPLTENEHVLRERFLSMIKTFKKAKAQLGFSHIVWPNAYAQVPVMVGHNYSSWVVKLPPKDLNEVMSFTKRPFVEDAIADQISVLDEYYFEDENNGIKQTHCVGLGTAHITESPAISVPGVAIWEKEKITFFNQNSETTIVETVEVFNVSTEASIEAPNFITFVESIATVNLVVTNLQPSEKTKHISGDHHGKDLLTAMASRMFNSEYVIGIPYSIAFNSHTTRFINKVFANGIVEIVLHWEDSGYGMAVQTTGRNLRETQAIAEKLRDEYDK